MKLLFYKGRWIDNSSATLWDNIICLVTWSKYSHVEVSINEYNGWHDCWSSSTRDDGVRKTRIYVDPSKWHIIPTDKPIELKLFEDNENASYDYIGLLGTVFKTKLFSSENKWFCSEIIAEALGFKDSWKFTPQRLYSIFK